MSKTLLAVLVASAAFVGTAQAAVVDAHRPMVHHRHHHMKHHHHVKHVVKHERVVVRK